LPITPRTGSLSWPDSVEPSLFVARRSALWACLVIVPMAALIAIPTAAILAKVGASLLIVFFVYYGLVVLRMRVAISPDRVAIRRLFRWKHYEPGDRLEVRNVPQIFAERERELVVRSARSSSRIPLGLFPIELRAHIVNVITKPEQ
jgi:hypothetical protein